VLHPTAQRHYNPSSGGTKNGVERFANHCRLDVANRIDKALIEYANSGGYTNEGPRR
jgi:hypothetical protein